MTNISFYLSQGNQLQHRLWLACKLVEKARKKRLQTHIHTDNEMTSRRMDDLLWSYNDLSFIPHAIAPTKDEVPVTIGYNYEPTEKCDFLINLSNRVPAFFSRFNKFAEILDQSDEILNEGRRRYIFYRDSGYNLQYYKL